MTHSHDVQKIHTHYLAASSSLEICEFTADFGATADSDVQHGVYATPPVEGIKLTGRKGWQEDLFLIFLITIKTSDTLGVFWQCYY